jgi:hypothetical protein
VFKGLKEDKVLKDLHKVLKELADQQVPKVPKVVVGQLVLQDHKVHKDQQELRVHKEPIQGPKVI